MARIERLTVTLPVDLVTQIEIVVSEGEYASSSEVVREALQDWQLKLELRRRKLEALRRDIDEGLEDVRLGRHAPPDLESILAEGKRLAALDEPSG